MTSFPGDLVRSRVVEDPTRLLGAILDREFTGHIVLEPGNVVLLDESGQAILGVEAGIPRYAYHAGIERGGEPALKSLTGAGPYKAELYACDASVVGDRSPGAPIDATAAAKHLTTNDALIRRTRATAPETDAPDRSLDAVESFLEDEETVDAIRERAREEATRRAAEWGFDPE